MNTRYLKPYSPRSVSGRFSTVSQISETFLEDYSKHHIPLSSLQRVLLAVGSSAISLANPFRGDMIACLAETTGTKALMHCHRQMKSTEEGQRILARKPRINTSTIDLSYLKSLPEGTVGRTYHDFLDNNVRLILPKEQRNNLFVKTMFSERAIYVAESIA